MHAAPMYVSWVNDPEVVKSKHVELVALVLTIRFSAQAAHLVKAGGRRSLDDYAQGRLGSLVLPLESVRSSWKRLIRDGIVKA